MGRERRARLPAVAPALGLLLAGAVALSGPGGEGIEQLAGPDPGGVTGRIFGPDHRPATGVTVTLRRGEESWSARTDEVGSYCFCRMKPARDYRLSVRAEGLAGWEERDLMVSRGRLTVRNLILRALSEFQPPTKEPE